MSQVFDDLNFDREVLQAPVPVLVDFWAPWCPPCRQLAPVIDKVAREMAGTVRVGKVNVDENPGLAQSYNVERIPVLLFFHKGRVAGRLIGVQSKERIKQELEALR